MKRVLAAGVLAAIAATVLIAFAAASVDLGPSANRRSAADVESNRGLLGLLENYDGGDYAAIGRDPTFTSAYNTLGVIYRRHGNLPEAERTLAFALEREPKNTHVMSNLLPVLEAMGRKSDATALARKLAELDPHPPFSYFMLGMHAMRERNFTQARDLFAKEVDRAPYYHEFHFWLAQSYLALGQIDQAKKQLALALEYSDTAGERALYAAKLVRINSGSIH